ncbi:MAG: hypothetical protein FD127_855 [Acidimicrobiaceae bacterium]|nr:MAG: hypothetical protein FD127_855 [Acidimicrobiaceae bacterium]
MNSQSRLLVGLVLVGALVGASCGSDSTSSQETAGPGATTNSTAAPDTLPATSDSTAATDPPTTESEPAALVSRFTGTDEFCTAAVDEPTETPTETDPGITADSISITHVRYMLEDLVSIGFGLDNGDAADQVQTFVDVINEQCGGINGRMLDLSMVEESPLSGDPALDARTDCTTIAEDEHAVAAFSFTGIGQPLASCLTTENDVIYLTTYDVSKSEFDQAGGRLFSVNHGPADILTYAVRQVAPLLEGKRIGVVYDDTTPNPEVVQTGLIEALAAAGLEPVRVDVIGCLGEYQCGEGVIPSVQGMIADGVDVIFPLLNTLSLPTYMGELATQGVQPGDIQFYNTSFLAQDSEFVSGKMVEFGGDLAGKIYDGAIIISASRAGEHRLPDFTVDPFVQMCNDTYVANSTKVTTPYDFLDDDGNRQASSVASHCSGIRLLARAIEAAGVNPTRADIAEALANLGPIDSGEGSPSSFVPGKPTAPDVIVQETFHYPCPQPTTNSVGNCILPDTDYLPIPQG